MESIGTVKKHSARLIGGMFAVIVVTVPLVICLTTLLPLIITAPVDSTFNPLPILFIFLGALDIAIILLLIIPGVKEERQGVFKELFVFEKTAFNRIATILAKRVFPVWMGGFSVVTGILLVVLTLPDPIKFMLEDTGFKNWSSGFWIILLFSLMGLIIVTAIIKNKIRGSAFIVLYMLECTLGGFLISSFVLDLWFVILPILATAATMLVIVDIHAIIMSRRLNIPKHNKKYWLGIMVLATLFTGIPVSALCLELMGLLNSNAFIGFCVVSLLASVISGVSILLPMDVKHPWLLDARPWPHVFKHYTAKGFLALVEFAGAFGD